MKSYVKHMLNLKGQLTDHINEMLENVDKDVPLKDYNLTLSFGDDQSFLLPLNSDLLEDLGKLIDNQIKQFSD